MVKKHDKGGGKQQSWKPKEESSKVPLDWWRLSKAEENRRRKQIERDGLPVRCEVDGVAGVRGLIKISTHPCEGFTHLCKDSAIDAAPWQYHISLCDGEDITTPARQAALDEVRRVWNNTLVTLRVEWIAYTCTVMLCPVSDALSQDRDVLLLRAIGSHGDCDRLSVSMGFRH